VKLEDALTDPFITRVAERIGPVQMRPDVAEPGVRMAAVALILRVPRSGLAEMLLIKRAHYEGDPWSGHIALPGGRREERDEDLVATAVRETQEEVAIDLRAEGHLLGVLSDVRPQNPRLPRIAIRPVVAVVDSAVDIVPSTEVAETFWTSVEILRDPGSRMSREIIAGERTFQVLGYRVGEHFIWGLTEKILREFFDRVGEEG
jgi:8-oxo-dGTP pyrophosphatase MutT (NUDIX family)